jgi:hypothetical protein
VANSLGYLASPYTHYFAGRDKAFSHAAKISARLRSAGLFIYSPIVHLHPLTTCHDLDPLDLTLWYPHNHVMMERCDCLIVAHMEGWDTSDGVKSEIEYFKKMDKPIFDLDPVTLSMTKRIDEKDPRMQLTLDDVKAFSGPKRTQMPPLAMPDPKGQ